nr:RNA-directed DNA polymerase, eukaryota, reverse transcriptase zinc-binding domain protein [Tanacetum cinerariifolium]
MENLDQLRIKRQMLMFEMNMIEQKIALLEATTTVTDVPKSESLKTKAIPQQTAPGKESTNPLKAEVLLKSLTKDNTDPNSLSKTSKLVHSNPPPTTCSSKMTILSSNNLMHEFTPDYLKAVKQEPKYYYVIYRGPHAGIHTEWGIAKTFVDADQVTCKKFKSEESARISLATYSQKDPKLIQQAFEAGLINNIYPSHNLQELRHFPQPMVDSIKNFRKKVLKAKDDPIIHQESDTNRRQVPVRQKAVGKRHRSIQKTGWLLIDQPILKRIYPNNHEKLSHGGLEFSFRRNPRGGVEQTQFERLKEMVEGVTLSNSNDRWSSSLVGSGDFSVSLVRKFY